MFHNDTGLNEIMLVKDFDELLITDDEDAAQTFLTKLEQRLKVGRIIRSSKLIYNKLRIERHPDKSTTFSMDESLPAIIPIKVACIRRKEATEPCTADEISARRRLAGELNYIRHGLLHPACFAALNISKDRRI